MITQPIELESLPEVPAPVVAEAIVTTLRRHGIDVLFNVPGGPLMPFLKACRKSRGLRVITCRHETAACIMAGVYYQQSARTAAVALTSGPGAANAVNGIVHALREQCALVIISARPASHKVGRGAVQDFDTARFLAAVTKDSQQLLHPSQVDFLLPRLVQTAQAPTPGPVNLTLCSDQVLAPVGAA